METEAETRWEQIYRRCPAIQQGSPKAMKDEEIINELNGLLYMSPEKRQEFNAVDRELLTILIPREKKHIFTFLTGRTEWKVVGRWVEPDENVLIEKNALLEVEFKDNPDECIGNRVIHLLNEYIQRAGERMPYARTVPVEEGTLE